ncbi:hypothetical protein [Rhodococcus opacus]|uniref:hypothetical protein n=1 Tax=Rhodococcus opacus TaxID=37919 RepID=UPI0034E085E6
MHHVRRRVALIIAKRHRRSREYGWSVLAYQSPDHLGIALHAGPGEGSRASALGNQTGRAPDN